MLSVVRRITVLLVAGGTIALALLAAFNFGGESELPEPEPPPPPDAAFMERTGLSVRFVEQHESLPVTGEEAAEIGGRGAPAVAWLTVVEPAAGQQASVPGLIRLAEYVEYQQPLWFVVIDEVPDLGEANAGQRQPLAPRADDSGAPWFNVAFVDPYTGTYVLGLAGLVEEDDEDDSAEAGEESAGPGG